MNIFVLTFVACDAGHDLIFSAYGRPAKKVEIDRCREAYETTCFLGMFTFLVFILGEILIRPHRILWYLGGKEKNPHLPPLKSRDYH